MIERKFKQGDRVKLQPRDGFITRRGYKVFAASHGATATVEGYREGYVWIRWDRNGLDGGQNDGGYYEYDFVLATPSLATEVGLKPQAKTVLGHLRRHGHITPAKAYVVYGIPRLAASINDLRKAGYGINTILRRDEGGHGYARYELAA